MNRKSAVKKSSKAAVKKTAKPPAAPAGKPRATAPTAQAEFSLGAVFAALRKRVPAARQAEAVAFADAFYKRMEADEYAHHSAEGWAALAGDMLDFVRGRKPGAANVRVFNPSLNSQGWDSPHSVLQIANDDMPFLVDSVSMALADLGIGVHVRGHPVIRVGRDRNGKLTEVGEGKPESMMFLEIDRQPAEQMPKIEARVREVLGQVRAIVQDWSTMREKMLAVSDDLATRRMPVSDAGRREAQEFLRWAANDHFTYFGYREYRIADGVLQAIDGSGLGLLRGKESSHVRPVKTLAAHYMPQSGSVDTLILTKTNARSTVHRPGNMDYIGVLEFDAKGNPMPAQEWRVIDSQSRKLQ